MKILIVDDDINRHVHFLRWFRDATVVSAGSYDEAIHDLETGSPFDVLYLDYDLGSAYNGVHVIDFVTHHLAKSLWPKLVVIHSWNPLGVIRLKRALRPTGIPTKVEPYGFRL